MHFKDSKGNLLKTVEANEGDDLLTIAHEYDIDLEGTEYFHVGDCFLGAATHLFCTAHTCFISTLYGRPPYPPPPLRSRIFLPTPSFRSLTLTWAGSASEGACEGSIACSTCHVILTPEFYDKLLEPSDDENDMLDMAFGLTDTSRLGCQVQLTKDLDGMIVTLPSATRNMFVDGRY